MARSNRPARCSTRRRTYRKAMVSGELSNTLHRRTARIEALPVVDIHKMDNPFFDILQRQQPKGLRGVTDELETHLGIGADDHTQPVQHKFLLPAIKK